MGGVGRKRRAGADLGVRDCDYLYCKMPRQHKVSVESLKEQDLRLFFTQITPESPNPNSNNGLPKTVSRILSLSWPPSQESIYQ